jgi:hypothetical protein
MEYNITHPLFLSQLAGVVSEEEKNHKISATSNFLRFAPMRGIYFF